MFQRRIARNKQQILREALWPSMGARRLAVYYKHRIGRLPGTPTMIASGFATGVAISVTPFVGFHILIGAAIAWLTRGSLIAMAIGTFFGNPWTFPAIWYVTFKVGHLMLGNFSVDAGAETFSMTELLEHPLDLLWPLTLGAVPVGIILWLLSFYGCRTLVLKYRRARLARILERAA